MNTLDLIRQHLRGLAIDFREVHHAPTFTSEESAKARGEDLRIGGKALLMKTGDVFRLFVLSASLRADSAAIRDKFGVKKTRFATPEELLALTGLVPGSVPPFGQRISRSAALSAPRPKCSRKSFTEKKLAWLSTA